MGDLPWFVRCANVASFYQGAVTARELMELPVDFVLALQASVRAGKSPEVKAWEEEKARTKRLHDDLRKGRTKV
jgi:hypothetical protein